MSGTYGSQIFGQWYDLLGPIFLSCIFYYFSLKANNLPQDRKEKMPAILLYKNLFLALIVVFSLLAVHRIIVKHKLDKNLPAQQENFSKTKESNKDNSIPHIKSSPEKWVKIEGNDKDTSLYIGDGSIKRNGDLVEYWAKIHFASPRIFRVGSITTLIDKYVINCRNMTRSQRDSNVVTDENKVVSFSFTPKEQEFMPIDSAQNHEDQIFARYVCSFRQ